jgi:DNA polymerase-3 subunit alpha
VALADRNGLYAAMPFSEACIQGRGPADHRHPARGQARPNMPEGVTAPIDWLALYGAGQAGYENLCDLVSKAHLDRPIEDRGRMSSFEQLKGRTDGLLVPHRPAPMGALARLYAEQQDSAVRWLMPICSSGFSPTGSISRSSAPPSTRSKGASEPKRARLCLCPATFR